MDTLSTLSSRLWLRRWSNFTLCPNLDPKNAPFIYVSHGSVLFLPGLKSRLNLLSNCFSAVEPRVIYSTSELLSATNKDVLPALQKSSVIYQFSCHCDSRYVGRTSQRLQDRIKQLVPKSIRSCFSSQKRLLPARRCKSSTQTNTQSLASDSAIGLHLLQNLTCAQHYDDSRFSILAQGRSLFHLSALEATFIKTSNPALCRQKEFVYSLKIVH